MLEDSHRVALKWFADHTGTEVAWSVIQDYSTSNVRLVTQAKGIFKPAGVPYALSIRQTIDGNYPDKDVEQLADGGWQYRYHQEGSDPTRRDRLFTNRGLMKCLEDGVPIGVLIQTSSPGPVSYRVLGLGSVTDWTAGFFSIVGPSRQR